MALYCSHCVRHRGRLIEVPLRYGSYGGGGRWRLVKGKKIRFSPKDFRKVILRARQAHGRVDCFAGR